MTLLEQVVGQAPDVVKHRYELSNAINSLGTVLMGDEQYKPAEQAVRRGLEMKRELATEFPSVPEYRRGVAIGLTNLGILAKNTDRYPQAEELYREALQVHQSLVEDFPDVADHHNEVAGAMTNLGRILLMRNTLSEARELLEGAVPYHQTALRGGPNHPAYRNFFRINRWRLTETLLAQEDHAAAAEMACQFRDLAVELPRDAYTATTLLAECVRLATEDPQLSSEQRDPCVRQYVDQACRSLQLAHEKGWRDFRQLQADEMLAPLRNVEEFRALAAQLEAQEAAPTAN